MKPITELRKAPQVMSSSPGRSILPPMLVPPIILISGVRKDSVNWLTTPVKAAPITIPTARSTTLPREIKSLKPLSTIELLYQLLWRCTPPCFDDKLMQLGRVHLGEVDLHPAETANIRG